VEPIEANMVITSANKVALKEYQMKLSIRQKDGSKTIVSIICLMMQMEWGMEVHIDDTPQMNLDDGISLLFEHLPESAEERELYFKTVYDKCNKSGTSIVLCIASEHSHVKW
jgi:hypothetical protein